MAISWVLTVLWAVQIFWFSTAGFGGAESRSSLVHMLAHIGLDIPVPILDLIHAGLRKLAHVLEYAVLSVLLYRSISEQNRLRWEPGAARTSLLISAVYAATDELHQIFVPGRHASLADWGLDTAAAIFVVAMVYIVSRSSENVSIKNAGSGFQNL